MTRFWLSLEQGVRFVIRCIEIMQGGEVFIPKIPSMRVIDLANAIAPGCKVERIGIRAGEKLHEVLLSEDEARHAVELEDMFIVPPPEGLWFGHEWEKRGTPLAEGFCYTSDTNRQWLNVEEIQRIVELFETEGKG
jgi:UDP-N-acetylglucosamine 4,6-dehydratase